MASDRFGRVALLDVFRQHLICHKQSPSRLRITILARENFESLNIPRRMLKKAAQQGRSR